MSILVGLVVRKARWNLSTYCEKDLYECTDLQDAREKILQARKSGVLNWENDIVRAELHDTDNGRTWSVNADGISQRDYHYENTERFKNRWLHIWQRK